MAGIFRIDALRQGRQGRAKRIPKFIGLFAAARHRLQPCIPRRVRQFRPGAVRGDVNIGCLTGRGEHILTDVNIRVEIRGKPRDFLPLPILQCVIVCGMPSGTAARISHTI